MFPLTCLIIIYVSNPLKTSLVLIWTQFHKLFITFGKSSKNTIFRKLTSSKTMMWDYIHTLSRWLKKWSWTISLRTWVSYFEKWTMFWKNNILRRMLRIHSIWPMKYLCGYTFTHMWLVYFFSRGNWIILILFWFIGLTC